MDAPSHHFKGGKLCKKKKKTDIFRAIRGYPIFRCSPWENMNDKTEDLYKSYKNMNTSSTLW